MIGQNLRHLRLFLAVAEAGSATGAAMQQGVSQPAVTQALAKLETAAGARLFERGAEGLSLTPAGTLLAARVRRALGRLDTALAEIAPRLRLTATQAQLRALVAVVEARSFSLAARQLGLSQPSIHRAVASLEAEAGRPLLRRTGHGLVPTPRAAALAVAAQLAGAEIAQGEAELAELAGGEGGRIVIGALPLARSLILPQALIAFRARRPAQPVTVIDGPYEELLAGLRRGEIDVIAGALRSPCPAGIAQERLFDDRLAFLAGHGHPLAGQPALHPEELARWPFVVPRVGTPARAHFDALFGGQGPASLVETGSILLMRQMLRQSDHLGCISAAQAGAELALGLLVELPVAAEVPGRPIGLATRPSWVPTAGQAALLEELRRAARQETSANLTGPGTNVSTSR
ncbi:LysR family transcriptional regulator [Pseudoroseicyclus sp. H15]